MRTAKAHNPVLHAINPFGSKPTRKRTKKTNPAKKAAAKQKNPSTRRTSNPFNPEALTQGLAAGIGAIATTFVANMLPLPTNGLLNAGVKAAVGYGLGALAKNFSATSKYSTYIAAGGIGVGAADALKFAVPRFRTIFVPTEPEAQAVKDETQGQLQDVVLDGYMLNGLGDVTDSVPFRSDWASAPM